MSLLRYDDSIFHATGLLTSWRYGNKWVIAPGYTRGDRRRFSDCLLRADRSSRRRPGMSTRRIESFLLRLVVEETNSEDTDEWRGRIQHIGSGYERQFERLEDIIAFITQQFAGDRTRSLGDDEPAAHI